MFTGIIKAKGTISAMQQRGGDVRLSVRSDRLPWADYEIGESISVNGVCLTAVTLHEDGFDTDVSVETLDVTALGRLGVGSPVNLEPALSLNERLGGHLGYGVGIHLCVGMVIARMEGEAVLRALATRVDRLEIVGEVRPRLNNSLRGLDALPLRITAAR